MNDIFHAIFKEDSSIGFITGKRGSGKTDFCLLLLEDGQAEGYFDKIACNVATHNDPAVEFIRYMDNLEDWLNGPGRKAYFLDELGKHLYRMSFMSQKAKVIIHLCQLIRKYDAHLLGAAPSMTLINKLFLTQELLDFRMVKLSRKTVFVKKFPPKPRHVKLQDVPRTSIRFRTKYIAEFELIDPTRGKSEFDAMPLEEQAVLLYAKHHNMRNTAKAMQLSPMHVSRLLKKALAKRKLLL